MPPHADDSSEDEFEFSGPSSQPAAAAAIATRTTVPTTNPLPITRTATHLSLPRKEMNQPYDEAVELSASDVESVVSADNGSPLHGKGTTAEVAGGRGEAGKVLDADESEEDDDDEEEDDHPARPAAAAATVSAPPRASPKASTKAAAASALPPSKPSAKAVTSESEEEEEEEESDDEQAAGAAPAPRSSAAKLYNAADFAHLTVSSDISDLFTYITTFKAADIELDTKFLPFIPEYIPAIGDIDAYLKVAPPQPNIALDGLGLSVLDEPNSLQSDASVLEMTLRVMSKGIAGSTSATVARIDYADRQPARIDRWIDSIEKLHEQKPHARVQYSSGMPDIEQLMAAWPAEVEGVLRQVGSEVEGLDLSVGELARTSCSLLGIPVQDGKLMESLHVLFTLYHEFSNNSHFQQV